MLGSMLVKGPTLKGFIAVLSEVQEVKEVKGKDPEITTKQVINVRLKDPTEKFQLVDVISDCQVVLDGIKAGPSPQEEQESFLSAFLKQAQEDQAASQPVAVPHEAHDSKAEPPKHAHEVRGR